MKWMIAPALLGLIAPAASTAGSVTVDFEDLGVPASGFVNDSGGFESRGASFNNEFTDYGNFTAWSGWSYSNRGSTIDGGVPPNDFFGYQYDSTTGGDATTGSGLFGVAFGDGAYVDLPETAGASAFSAKFTNTAYTVLSILNGDSFAKKFGGTSGNDADFLLLTITGFDGLGATGDAIGSVPFYLADYRFDDNALDDVVRDWETVDLSTLIGASSLGFSFASSDVGDFGINTPTYFAMDDLAISFASVAVPEPATAGMLALGLFGIAAIARRGRGGPHRPGRL